MFCGSFVGIEIVGASIFYGLLVGLHVLVAFLLIVIVLMQASKGGGLSGAFGTGAGSSPLFGAATSTVLVRTTTVLGVIFAITCISIAAIQSRKASIMRGVKQPKKEATAEPSGEGVGGTEGQGEPLSPVEGEQGKKEEPGAEGEAPAVTKEEPALSPVEGESAEKGPKPAPPDTAKPMSPVEGENMEKESPPPPSDESLSPVEGGGVEPEPTPIPAAPEENLSPVEGAGAAG